MEYQEKGLRAWAFNVASDDIEPVVTLSVSVDDDTVPRPPGLPGQIDSIPWSVHDPSLGPPPANVVISSDGLFPPLAGPALSPGSPVALIAFANPNAGPGPKTYVLRLDPREGEQHYKLTKKSGPDHGNYAMRCPRLEPTVEIDIKPGSDPNCFNVNGRGTIPVAILGSSTFDVQDVDVDTVELKGMAVKAVGKGNKLLAAFEDVNDDGFLDLVVKIEDTDNALEPGDGETTLRGKLLNGAPLMGKDSICITQ